MSQEPFTTQLYTQRWGAVLKKMPKAKLLMHIMLPDIDDLANNVRRMFILSAFLYIPMRVLPFHFQSKHILLSIPLKLITEHVLNIRNLSVSPPECYAFPLTIPLP